MKARARITNTQFYCPIYRLPIYAVYPDTGTKYRTDFVKIPSSPTNFSDIGEKRVPGTSKWRCPDVVKNRTPKNPAQWDFIGS